MIIKKNNLWCCCLMLLFLSCLIHACKKKDVQTLRTTDNNDQYDLKASEIEYDSLVLDKLKKALYFQKIQGGEAGLDFNLSWCYVLQTDTQNWIGLQVIYGKIVGKLKAGEKIERDVTGPIELFITGINNNNSRKLMIVPDSELSLELIRLLEYSLSISRNLANEKDKERAVFLLRLLKEKVTLQMLLNEAKSNK